MLTAVTIHLEDPKLLADGVYAFWFVKRNDVDAKGKLYSLISPR
jgi:hypothetical protein